MIRRATEAQSRRAHSYGVSGFSRTVVCLCVALACLSEPAAAQINGHASVLFDVLPAVVDAPQGGSVVELRTRLFVEHRRDVGSHLRLNLSGHVDGLLADREATGGSGSSSDTVLRPLNFYAEIYGERFDLRIGASRLVWGRLDEFQPTDVVNPIDLTRFLLEGRSEARLPVGLVRGRAFFGASTLEGVVIPAFRASRFDQLEELTSPFNLFPLIPRVEPPVAWRNVQGGTRFTSTVGRLDWGVSAFRGFMSFPVVGPAFEGNHPRYTMIGADFETVRGQWGIRGEVATFDAVERRFEGGVGVDRRAGDYRIASNVLISHEPDDTDVTVVAAADRSFARETRTVRAFAVYNPSDGTAFVRGIAAVSLREDVWLEGSIGVFAGSSLEPLGLLTRRDFVYTRLKVFF